DARQFVAFADATAGGVVSRLVGLARLVVVCGPFETVRMLRTVLAGRRTVPSIATETYWSRGAIRWGDTLAVRYLLRPVPDTPPAADPARHDPARHDPARHDPARHDPARHDPDFLAHEAWRRLAAGDVRFELCVQRFRDSTSTPIEDTAVPWSERVSPAEPVAVLTIGRRDMAGAGGGGGPHAPWVAGLHPLRPP